MTNLITDLILFSIIAVGFITVLLKTRTMNKDTIFIVASLTVFWFLMYMQKNSSYNETNVTNTYGTWVWPVIAGLYQMMQVAFRLPYGKLSQKLKSRKQIVQISFFFVLISLTMMIASNLAVWSLIVAAISMGQYGSTFGLDSQYISENHNIRKVFASSSIAFVIPVIGSLGANVVYGSLDYSSISLENGAYFWMIFTTLMLGFVSFITYSARKENVATIRLDNVDPTAQVFVKRNMKDVFAVSLTAAFMAFAYNFVLGFSSVSGVDHYWMSVLQVASLMGSVLVGMILKDFVNGRFIRIISLSFLFMSTVMIGILFVFGDMTKSAFIILMMVASASFGMYVMALFGAALHFDHKYPALVLGIFLTLKSFALGSSTITSGEILVASPSNTIIGVVIISISVSFILAAWLASMFIVNRVRDNDMDKLIDDSFVFERTYDKLVGKIVTK